jgi:hypothetical protein
LDSSNDDLFLRKISRKFKKKISAGSRASEKKWLNYHKNDLIAIKRTQKEPALKLAYI